MESAVKFAENGEGKERPRRSGKDVRVVREEIGDRSGESNHGGARGKAELNQGEAENDDGQDEALPTDDPYSVCRERDVSFPRTPKQRHVHRLTGIQRLDDGRDKSDQHWMGGEAVVDVGVRYVEVEQPIVIGADAVQDCCRQVEREKDDPARRTSRSMSPVCRAAGHTPSRRTWLYRTPEERG